MNTMDGNDLQRRMMLEQVADAAVTKFRLENPGLFSERQEAEIPAPMKWVASIAASIFVVGVPGMMFWGVSTISTMQITLAKLEERVGNLSTNQKDHLDNIVTRVASLEDKNERSRKSEAN